jgi:hypothetical protein
MARWNLTERKGVNATEDAILKLEWVFREQDIDVGIDAIVEESISGNPTGKCLGLQIKSGTSHYHETDTDLTYYISDVHYFYWIHHSFPIVLILYNPDKKVLYWGEINSYTVKPTPQGGRKLVIPKSQVLDENSKKKLKGILYSFIPKGGFLDMTPQRFDLMDFNVLIVNIKKLSYLGDSFKNQNR